LSTAIPTEFQLAHFEDRPFFEKALRFGLQKNIITQAKVDAIATEAPKGIVQIAAAFGSQYLRPEIELARFRIVNLVSLYLVETSHGDVEVAANLIQENTFLSLSRGGSTLLKALFALPEYAVLGLTAYGRVDVFLEYWSRQKNVEVYQTAKRQRVSNQLEIALALKLAHTLGIERDDFQDQHSEADAVIRSALLLGLQKKLSATARCFNQIEFATLLNVTRTKGLRKTVKLLDSAPALEFSAPELAILTALQHDIFTHDLPKIQDADLSLDQLISQIKDRYFIRDNDMEDTASYDALVSKEWNKYTKGKNDIDSVLTLLLCLAAGVSAKTSLTEKAAKTLAKKIRADGFHPEIAREFVAQHAPHEKQASLLEDWDDFSHDVTIYVLDDWDTNLVGAMRFLRDNCTVEKSTAI